MMIRFSKSFMLPVETVFDYFASPDGWVRLYGFGGAAHALGDGWYEVPLKRFPFPLVARVVSRDENTRVSWIYRGFWRGEGEAHFVQRNGTTHCSGMEILSIRWLFIASRIVERLFLEQRFRAIWELGWRRLRTLEAQHGPTALGARK